MSRPDLAGTLDRAWASLTDGVARRDAPARQVVLATAGVAGGAEARMVVLRGADRAAATLTVHTDAASAKVAELARDPGAAVLVWDPQGQFQIRLRVRVSVRKGSQAEWQAIPEGAQRVYGGAPPPGSPVETPERHTPEPAQARFTILSARILEIETLHLAPDRHRRAVFAARDGFRGHWIAP